MGRSCPLNGVPFSSRKQSKPLQKVPLRLPRILSSCHLRTTWTRVYPDLFSLTLYLCPNLFPDPQTPAHTHILSLASRPPFSLLRTSPPPSSVPTCPTSWTPDLGYQGTEDGQEVGAKQPTPTCTLLPANRPRQQAKMAEYCRSMFGETLLTDPLENFPVSTVLWGIWNQVSRARDP